MERALRAWIHSSSIDIHRMHNNLILVGDAKSMKADIDQIIKWHIPHDLGCIGRSIRYALPIEKDGLLHWFNVDGSEAIWWAKRLPNYIFKHTLGQIEGFDFDWDMEQPDYHYKDITGELRTHGSTAFFAVLAGLALGYQKIVLAGCPLDCNGHWYYEADSPETLGPIWLGQDFMAWLDFAKTNGAKQVKSLSGYTSAILGQATKEWINA